MVKRISLFSAILFLLTLSIPAVAQKTRLADDVGVLVGVNIPLKGSSEKDVITGIYYGHTYYNGLGVRAGLQYSPSVADVDNYFGVPVSLTYKTAKRTAQEKIDSAFGAAHSAVDFYGPDAAFSDILSNFLFNLFGSWEFSLGLTPGYYAGVPPKKPNLPNRITEWIEKKYSPALSIDAGFGLNFNIWRFDLKFQPAIHYNLTDNLIYRVSSSAGQTYDHIRWFATISGGISFNF